VPIDEDEMKLYERLDNGLRFLWVSLLVMPLVGCGQQSPKRPQLVNTAHNSRLYWCIGLIESGKIRRGMDTNSLNKIFGERLHFYSENEATAFLPIDLADARWMVQLPPPWYIKFSINHEGIVTNFSLSKSSGK
jgi:hypothetical protein